MKITHDEIRHIAQLARIEIPEERFDKLAADMENIVDMVAQLQKVDLTGIEPDLSADYNVFREDIVEPSLTREQVLANAPRKAAGCILVPKIID
jgi:aspartyl-tRNA(Asn)/glutamyl-tRNA(Gln) amidotransferase subunit C